MLQSAHMMFNQIHHPKFFLLAAQRQGLCVGGQRLQYYPNASLYTAKPPTKPHHIYFAKLYFQIFEAFWVIPPKAIRD